MTCTTGGLSTPFKPQGSPPSPKLGGTMYAASPRLHLPSLRRKHGHGVAVTADLMEARYDIQFEVRNVDPDTRAD